MRYVAQPYRFDARGRTADRDGATHIRDLIEALLFTVPGERVNRPDFGSGLARQVFEANSPEIAAATQYLVQGNLGQWLSSKIRVDDVTVDVEDSTLRVAVTYELLADGSRQTATFERDGGRT